MGRFDVRRNASRSSVTSRKRDDIHLQRREARLPGSIDVPFEFSRLLDQRLTI